MRSGLRTAGLLAMTVILAACGAAHVPAAKPGKKASAAPPTKVFVGLEHAPFLPVLTPSQAADYTSLPWTLAAEPDRTRHWLALTAHPADCTVVRGVRMEPAGGATRVSLLGTVPPADQPCTMSGATLTARVAWPLSLLGTRIEHAPVDSR